MPTDALTAFLSSEPSMLSELETVLGPLDRDVSTDEAWLVRRKNLDQGITFVFAAFIGPDLRNVSDPQLSELRVHVENFDFRPVVAGILGPGVKKGGESTFDPHHDSRPSETPTYREWSQARGVFQVHDANPSYVFWHRHKAEFALVRSPAEEADLIESIAKLCSQQVTRASLSHTFGPFSMDGSYPQQVAIGSTWLCEARPIEGEHLDLVQLQLAPPLPAEPLVAALGWTDAIIRTVDVHMSMPVLTRANRHSECPAQFHVINDGLTQSATSIPAGRAYEIHGAQIRLACWR